MKRYIGTKTVYAEPFARDGRDGYNVTYKDGYASWSPKEAFDDAYVAVEDIPNRLTIDDLKAKVKHSVCSRIAETTTTLCTLTLENGFTVIGKSACIDPANFDAVIGEQIAYNDALEKMWELEGYLLAQRRFEAAIK